jgi:hypothetical protein
LIEVMAVALLRPQRWHLMRDLDDLFAALGRSEFRSRFRLGAKEQADLREKTLPVILAHGRQLITQRLAPAQPAKDGRQTPLRGHPVFIAQHATATCCRGCLAKWHYIDKGKPLSTEQIQYVLGVIERWLRAPHVQGRPLPLLPEPE